MSLLSDAMEDCVILDKITKTDGYGGVTTVYVEGAEFKAAITFDSSIEARLAEKQGVTSLYTVTTSRNILLEFYTIFRRKRDGKLFRVTSDGNDNLTPKSAGLDMRQVSAEKVELKNG